MAETIGYLIPHDNEKPIEQVRIDGTPEQLDALIAIPEYGHGMHSISTVRNAGIMFAYDDVGLLVQPDNINSRAMKLWANAAGVNVSAFRQYLVGNYVVMGIDDEGETMDVPTAIAEKLTSDWINK